MCVSQASVHLPGLQEEILSERRGEVEIRRYDRDHAEDPVNMELVGRGD